MSGLLRLNSENERRLSVGSYDEINSNNDDGQLNDHDFHDFHDIDSLVIGRVGHLNNRARSVDAKRFPNTV